MTVPVLETERLWLRQPRLDDFPAHAAMWADPRTVRHFRSDSYKVFDQEMCWLRFLRNFGQWQLFGYGFWGVEDKESGGYIGVVGFFNAKRDMDIPYRDSPETGWVVAPDFHGRRIASEALAAAMAWGDVHIDAPESWCMIAPDNVISQKTAMRLGYRPALETQYKGERVLTFRRPRAGTP